ncbi:hypothetical protein SAMN06296028_1103 [Kocuria indica]|uniref:Uncharacterized protein n=1 Tax=Kocuria marina subsp. indica TaxID=1049583 RepID=A0A1X7DAB7_9MICC|nr:hypothetical protein SAMN06296028_1103 [Kocuria indica]
MANDQHIRHDPTTRYPRPPFPPQRQEHPGVETRMQPKSDHLPRLQLAGRGHYNEQVRT